MGGWEHGRVGAWEGGSMGGWEHGLVGAWAGGSMGGGAGVGAWGWEHRGGCMGVGLHVGAWGWSCMWVEYGLEYELT